VATLSGCSWTTYCSKEFHTMANRISLCMIVKNSEATLPTCLRSVADLVHEMIVVDTGSTDRTKEIAAALGARVFDFAWCDSFAAARNESLRHATGDWIFWLDADEYLNEENRGKLRALFASLGKAPAAFNLKQRSAQVRPHDPPTLVDQCRLFRNHPEIRWSYRVHEQILPAIGRLGHPVHFTDICIDHSGYTDPATRAQKDQRNLRLLHLQEAEQPDEAFTLFNLGWAYQTLGQLPRALAYLRKSLDRADPSASIVRKLFTLIAQTHEKLGQPREALGWCRAGRVRFPDDAELLFHEGMLLKAQGDRRGAELAWRSLLEVQPGPHFASVDASLRGYKTRYHLGVLLSEQGRAAEAEQLLRAAVAEEPGFLLAWKELAELYLAQQNWAAFQDALGRLSAEGPMALERLVLEGQAHLARREFGPARTVLEAARDRFPKAFFPRLYLSRVLLEEGQDPDGAEAALRDLVRGAPRAAEPWRNLAVLLSRRGRPAEAVAVARTGRKHCPQDAGLLLFEGVFAAEAGDLATAEPLLLRYLQGLPAGGTATIEARQKLAEIYLQRGRIADAETQWRALLADQPAFGAAWRGLAEVCLRQGRWADAEAIAGRLPDGEAAAVRTRLQAQRNGHQKHEKAQKERPEEGEQGEALQWVPVRKCLRIALACYYPQPVRTETPYEKPLGGSESALCYLAEALAGQGQEVFLLNAGGAAGLSRGVPCLPLNGAAFQRLPALDALVVQNCAGHGRALRAAVGPRTRLIFWSQHADDQPAVQPLRDAGERRAYDAFILVSDWQREQYLKQFGLEPSRVVVLRNGIGPAFARLFAEEESITATKSRPPVLAYTSTPYRGLDRLLEAFPRIREAVPDTTLEVYSSWQIYGVPEAEDQARLGALYQQCREMEGVTYVGPVPQPELAQRLRRVAVLAYPNSYAETSCIAVLEALAAGCLVVTSALGALPETAAGFARLVPCEEDRAAYLERFVAETVAALEQVTAPEAAALEGSLRRQVDHVNAESAWPILAGRWTEWLNRLP
jgi:tetratricopeptide (TPR) repeat protein